MTTGLSNGSRCRRLALAVSWGAPVAFSSRERERDGSKSPSASTAARYSILTDILEVIKCSANHIVPNALPTTSLQGVDMRMHYRKHPIVQFQRRLRRILQDKLPEICRAAHGLPPSCVEHTLIGTIVLFVTKLAFSQNGGQPPWAPLFAWGLLAFVIYRVRAGGGGRPPEPPAVSSYSRPGGCEIAYA